MSYSAFRKPALALLAALGARQLTVYESQKCVHRGDGDAAGVAGTGDAAGTVAGAVSVAGLGAGAAGAGADVVGAGAAGLGAGVAGLGAGVAGLEAGGGAATLYIHDARAYRAFLGGSVSAARAYIEGWWSAGDLYALLRLAAANVHALNARMDGGWRRLPRLLASAAAAAGRRLLPRKSAKDDIAAHYDLSNDFFSLFLDETLAYSCAVFPNLQTAGSDTLAQASRNKLNLICNKLELDAQDELLDLGCGWGSMAFHAAQTHQCRVTALTLSAAQHAYLQTAPAVQSGQVQAVLEDYRDFRPPRKFRKLSSVEMIEAVGERHFNTYFERIRAFLTDDGVAQVQAILIPDARYNAARRDSDFIRQYVFPGGMLPSLAVIRRAAQRAGLRLQDIQDIGAHYAPTLLAWRQRFNAQRAAVKALGFNERFCRLWEYYFCYCAGGFAAGAISAAQLVFTPTR